ncbi:MAG: FkbM family methyltransferase [Beijerinckiaceae bacterium]
MLAQMLKPNSNIIEVGANIGAHSVFLARDVCPNGVLYCFEPRRIIFQLLCANIAINGLENVFTYQVGAGSKREATFEGSVPTQTHTNMGAYSIGAIPGMDERIEIMPLDEMIADFKTVSLLKADVEGYELEVLLGAEALIRRDRPLLYLENDRAEKSRDLISHVLDLEYDLWWHIVRLYRQDNMTNTKANIFGNVASFNIICIPKEKRATINGLKQITSPDDSLFSKKLSPPA